MRKIIVHYSILDATDADLTPVWGDDDDSSQLPTLDVFFDGIVELIHLGSVHEWLVTQDYARFPMRRAVRAAQLRDALRPDGELMELLGALVQSASQDSGVIAMCVRVAAYLQVWAAD